MEGWILRQAMINADILPCHDPTDSALSEGMVRSQVSYPRLTMAKRNPVGWSLVYENHSNIPSTSSSGGGRLFMLQLGSNEDIVSSSTSSPRRECQNMMGLRTIER
jgi:hypothetical protein